MHFRLLKTSVCVLGLVVLSGCGKGSEDASSSMTKDFTQAADALAARLGAPGEKTEMPAANDPAVAAFEVQAGRALSALGTDALPVDGFASFDAFCGKTAGIVGAYVSAGVGQAGKAGQAGADTQAAQIALMNSNAERYMDQMFTPLLFSAHCSAAHMPFLEKTVSEGDMTGKAAALNQVRDGAFGQVNGLLQMAAADDLDLPRRRRVVDLLAADAPNFAIAMPPARRQQLAAAAQELAGKLPDDARGQAAKIRAAFEQKECGKLCSLQ